MAFTTSPTNGMIILLAAAAHTFGVPEAVTPVPKHALQESGVAVLPLAAFAALSQNLHVDYVHGAHLVFDAVVRNLPYPNGHSATSAKLSSILQHYNKDPVAAPKYVLSDGQTQAPLVVPAAKLGLTQVAVLVARPVQVKQSSLDGPSQVAHDG